MSVFCFVFCRYALSAFAFGLAVIIGAPAMADGDIYVHAGANFKPVTIAVTPFAGEQAQPCPPALPCAALNQPDHIWRMSLHGATSGAPAGHNGQTGAPRMACDRTSTATMNGIPAPWRLRYHRSRR